MDARGRVIGVNSQIATSGAGGNVGVGFAVPANTVREVIPRLAGGQVIERAWIGVTTSEGSGGAAVEDVTSGGPAERAGLRPGADVIVGVGGEPVGSPEDLAAAIADLAPGESRPPRGGARWRPTRGRGHARHPSRARAHVAMTFASPAFLLALLLVPLLVAGYLWLERGRRRGAERFAAPAMLESVAPVRPGWRRHAPVWLYGVAATVLAVALARPQATVAVPVERAAVILAIDQSGSMEARDVEPTRLAAARRAARDFVEEAPDQLRVGAVTFNHAVARWSRRQPTAARWRPRSTRCAPAAARPRRGARLVAAPGGRRPRG